MTTDKQIEEHITNIFITIDNYGTNEEARVDIRKLIHQERERAVLEAITSMKQRFHEPIEHAGVYGSYVSIRVIDHIFDKRIAELKSKLKESEG